MKWKMRLNLVIGALLVLLALFGSAEATDANLVAHWTFDEGSGTIAYDSGGDNDGTLIGDPVWTRGQIDGALSFDGSGDYVNIGSTVTHNLANGTFAAWICPLDMGRYCGIHNFAYVIGAAYWPGELGFRVSGDGGGFATVQNTTYQGFYIPPDTFFEGTWYHVALTWDGSDWKGYVNGVEKGSLPSTLGTSASSPRDTLIGRGWDGCSWNGVIDDVRIYNTALSGEEVEQLYLEGFSHLELAVMQIEGALAEKEAVLDGIDVAMEKELMAYDALEALLASGDYGDLSKRDISAAQREVEFVVRCQERSRKVLVESVERLEDTLLSLGWEPEPEPNEPSEPNIPEPNEPGFPPFRNRVSC